MTKQTKHSAGEVVFISSQAKYQWTPNLTFKPKRMARVRNTLEGKLTTILAVCLLLSIAGNFIKK